MYMRVQKCVDQNILALIGLPGLAVGFASDAAADIILLCEGGCGNLASEGIMRSNPESLSSKLILEREFGDEPLQPF